MNVPENKNSFFNYLQLLLLPVARFCLRRSLKIQEIFEAAKIALIQSAEAEILSLGHKPTVSRISVMTGIHRGDVMRLYKEEGGGKQPRNLVSRVVGVWQNDQRFLTAQGKPRVLSFDGKIGEFAELVATESADVNPYTILFELERLGNVVRTPKGLQLVSQEVIVRKDTGEAFQLLAMNTDDLVSAVQENVFEKSDLPNLHLHTEYDNIAPQHLPAIRRKLLQEGTQFHRNMNKFLASFDRDIQNRQTKSSDTRCRVSLCSFSRAVVASAEALKSAKLSKSRKSSKG